jgi:hypothetical protein
MNKLFNALFVVTSIFASYSAQSANSGVVSPLPASTITGINNEVGSGTGVNVPALNRVISDASLINSSVIKPNLVANPPNGNYYNASSISGTLNGHAVMVYTTGGTPLGKLNISDLLTGRSVISKTQQVGISGLSTAANPETVVVIVDGVTIFDGKLVNRADVVDLARVLDILPALEVATSSSLASTSPSSVSSQLVYGTLNPNLLSRSHRERRSIIANRPTNFVAADLKYEQAKFTKTGENGDLKGGTMTMSTEVLGGIELGAYIPYDYMDFGSFRANRTGTMLYAKRNWDLPKSLQLMTMANFNYIATYVNQFSLTNTFGGGFGTSLNYDDGGDFVPRVSFAFQYNQDDYYKANDLIKDNHQYLIKTGASLGYRLLDNATLQTGFVYTRDLTSYKSGYNKLKDNDYFDINVGGSYAIADMWQVNLNYKRMLGLNSYYSNGVFLGTALDF